LGCPNFFGEHICDVQGGTPVHLEEEGVKSFESLQLPKDGGTSSLDGRKKGGAPKLMMVKVYKVRKI
jgi:hypothetical protein